MRFISHIATAACLFMFLCIPDIIPATPAHPVHGAIVSLARSARLYPAGWITVVLANIAQFYISSYLIYLGIEQLKKHVFY